ncbi:hypothetical protein [Nocardioides sp. Kera G14]|uniref:hypothetical protein n=1 Tax=Nocardioides sp. Kera G14 TaxID=2884264 RepID=UPI001D1138F0|nr:hypothetical protein [Nocardioides sp. Kera G14]UDY24235.1 hypothetical protein LH076_02760 [Nocardioides sp. Kera G14]
MTPTMRRTSVFALAVALCFSLVTAGPASAKKGSCGRASGCTKFELIHAGSTYGWYPAAKRMEFESAKGVHPPAAWSLNGHATTWASGKAGSGTLKTMAGPDAGNLFTTWRFGKVNGRWEVRFRSLSKRDPGSSTIQMQNPSTGAWENVPAVDYNVRLELVPYGSPAVRCTPTSILMSGYNPAVRRTATIGVTAPGATYAGTVTPWSQVADLNSSRHWSGPVNSKQSAWHVWAVELKPTVITWFLDGKVVRRAPRPASIRNTAFMFRETLLASTDASKHTALVQTQLDWARYWTLKRTTKKKKKRRALNTAPLLARSGASSLGPC